MRNSKPKGYYGKYDSNILYFVSMNKNMNLICFHISQNPVFVVFCMSVYFSVWRGGGNVTGEWKGFFRLFFLFHLLIYLFLVCKCVSSFCDPCGTPGRLQINVCGVSHCLLERSSVQDHGGREKSRTILPLVLHFYSFLSNIVLLLLLCFIIIIFCKEKTIKMNIVEMK